MSVVKCHLVLLAFLVLSLSYIPDLLAKSTNKFINYMEEGETNKLAVALESDKPQYQEERRLYLNTRDSESGQTPLITAVDWNLPRSTGLFLEAHADVNLQDNDGNTALMIAALNDRLNLVEKLIKYGANYELQNNDGDTAYSLATEHNAKDVLTFFNSQSLIPKSVTKDAFSEKRDYRPDLDQDDQLVKYLPNMDGFDIYSNLHVQNISFSSVPLPVFRSYPTNKGLVSFGAEKEGTTSHIVNVATPKTEIFQKYVKALSPSDRKDFLFDLLSGLQDGQYREENIVDMNGTHININYDAIFPIDKKLKSLPVVQLENIFARWLDQTKDHPFTFLKREVRAYIFRGYLPSGTSFSLNRANTALLYLGYKFLEKMDYKQRAGSTYRWPWLPHFGISEKYIERIVNAAEFKPNQYLGWEINTKIIRSPGEYEAFLEWMRHTIPSDKDDDFNSAPGHQRIVFPQYKGLSVEKNKETHDKMMEFFRHIQAYVLLKTVGNHTGILAAKWQQALLDKELIEDKLTEKGVIRKEFNRWENHTGAIEIRTGVKNVESQRMIQKSLIARIVAQDWDDIATITSWKLVPDYLVYNKIYNSSSLQDLATRFDVESSDITRALNAIAGSKVLYSGFQNNYESLIPFWNWEDAPYLSKFKKQLLKSLTRDLIFYIGRVGSDYWKIRNAFADWCKSSNLALNIMDYLRPTKKWNSNYQSPEIYSYGPSVQIKTDVNKIDLGIEYTGRYPLATTFTKEKGVVVSKNIDLTESERHTLFHQFAKALAVNLGFGDIEVVDHSDKTIHGHGINLTVNFHDPKDPNKSWKVEWDGIYRLYDTHGNKIDDYLGGGHMEIVTPKFIPTFFEINAIYKTLKQFSIVPVVTAGAAHINIDLAPFDGNPHALARFLGTFYSYRGIIAMMFQNINRLRTAEPLDIHPNLQQQFANFQGTEEQLKALLYNYRHFNTRMSRKTRYVQLDVSSYFQDVIPAEFISNDFDILNPTIPWRPQFRVSPNVRKMEFRLFDAPKNAYEAGIQIKLVRALLNKALNSEDPISPVAQNINYENYVASPKLAFNDLKKMTQDLGLSFNEYKGFLGDALSKNQIIIRKKNYKPYAVRMQNHPKLADQWWGMAVPARNLKDGIDCKISVYNPSHFMIIPELNEFNEGRIKSLQSNDEKRLKKLDALHKNHAFTRKMD